ncbi:MAG: response regulator [bacterium]
MRQKKFNILIINKNPKILDSLGLTLAEKGHLIMFALNLEMALEIMNNVRINLVIIGIIKEIENQAEILKKLKELFPMIPALITSGDKLKNKEYLKLLHYGASGFITASLNTEELERVFNRAVK